MVKAVAKKHIILDRTVGASMWADHDCPIHSKKMESGPRNHPNGAPVCFKVHNKKEIRFPAKSYDLYRKEYDPIRELIVEQVINKYLAGGTIDKMVENATKYRKLLEKAIKDLKLKIFRTDRWIKNTLKELKKLDPNNPDHIERINELTESIAKAKERLNSFMDLLVKAKDGLVKVEQTLLQLQEWKKALEEWISEALKDLTGVDVGLTNKVTLGLGFNIDIKHAHSRCYDKDHWLVKSAVLAPNLARLNTRGNVANICRTGTEIYKLPANSKGHIHLKFLQDLLGIADILVELIPGVELDMGAFNVYQGCITDTEMSLNYKWLAGRIQDGPTGVPLGSSTVEDARGRKFTLHRLYDALDFNGKLYGAFVNITRGPDEDGVIVYRYEGKVFYMVKNEAGWGIKTADLNYKKESLEKSLDSDELGAVLDAENIKLKRHFQFLHYADEMTETYN